MFPHQGGALTKIGRERGWQPYTSARASTR